MSSRTQTDRQLALERMGRIGAFVNTTESVALSLVGDAAHPKFKVNTAAVYDFGLSGITPSQFLGKCIFLQEVQMLIKDLAFDTGLVRAEKALNPADPGPDDLTRLL